MPNYKQAPKLYHDKSRFNSNNYYNLPQELMDKVFNELDGKCGNQIKLITVLLGTLGNGSFGVSEKWICDRTGMVQQTYSKARQALVEKGWVYVEDGNLYLLPMIIRFGFDYPEGATPEERNAIKQKTISRCVNDIKTQYGLKSKTQCDVVKQTQCEILEQTQYEVVNSGQCDVEYNIINSDIINTNINNNNINNNSIGISPPDGADSPIQPVGQKIDGEITQEMADNIISKEMITDDLLFIPSTGKYFRIRR